MRTLLLSVALALPALAGDEAPTFAVLKIVRGDEIDFKVLAAKEAGAEKERLAKEAKAAQAEWEKQKQAFEGDKANRKKRFRTPRPDPVAVTRAKEGFTSEEEARRWADAEKAKADGKWAVVRVIDTDRSASLQIVQQRKVKALERQMDDKFETDLEDFQTKRDAHYGAGGGAASFTEVEPVKAKVVRLKENLNGQDAAEKALEEIQKSEPARK